MEEYQGNSRSTKRVEPKKESKDEVPEKNIKKVITGEATRRKKPLGKRFIETMLGGDDARGVWGYIAQEILVPAIKSTVTDAVTGGIERAVYGDVRGRTGGSRAPYSGAQRVAYNTMSRTVSRDEPRGREMTRRERATHDFDGLILPRRVDAEEVLDQMFEILSQYKIVSIADLYDMVGQQSNYTDRDWGWDDLRGADIQGIKGGFLLNLPRPIQL